MKKQLIFIQKYKLRSLGFGLLMLAVFRVVQRCTSRGLRKREGLPIKGKIRFVPRQRDVLNCRLHRVNGKFEDKFGNLWGKPKGHLPQGPKHWDVQLSNTGKRTIGHWSNSGEHVNVTEEGFVPH
jgi:hypothetical protein